jgi:nicotinamidase-related amidase
MSNGKRETRETRKLNPEEALLIVVDIQEKIIPAMHHKLELLSDCETLIKGCRILGAPVIFTQQYSKGLGATIPVIADAATTTIDSATENVASAGENPIEDFQPVSFSFVEKTSFSIVDEPDFRRELKKYDRRDLILCGVEAHVCVLQSVLDLLDDGFRVFVAANATSSRKPIDQQTALDRMGQAGAVISTVEALLFELLGNAKAPKFKEISKLVR